jgi:hypothetical protein
MKAFEFESSLNANQALPVPPSVAEQLRHEQPLRVIVLVAESAEDAAWRELTVEQFQKGYADGDAIYDRLPAG